MGGSRLRMLGTPSQDVLPDCRPVSPHERAMCSGEYREGQGLPGRWEVVVWRCLSKIQKILEGHHGESERGRLGLGMW